MVIRQEQMKALSVAMEHNFQRQLVRELHDFAPWQAEVLGDSGLLRCVQFGMERARGYGFTNRGPIRLYAQMIFLLGSEFDTDPLLPWAGQVLRDPATANQTDRANYLYEALNEYLAQVAGPDKKFAKDTLVRAQEELDNGLESAATDPLAAMLRIYPEKCAYVGEDAVQQAVQSGVIAATRRNAATSRGKALFCGLIFAFGHGFETDPHLPWIQKTLEDPSLTEERLVDRLASRVKTYLDYTLRHVM